MQMSPFEVGIGYVPILPLDIYAIVTPRMILQANDGSSELLEFVQALQSKAKPIWERLHIAHEDIIELANRKQRRHNFRTGNKVV
jgi:hypothetical protein